MIFQSLISVDNFVLFLGAGLMEAKSCTGT